MSLIGIQKLRALGVCMVLALPMLPVLNVSVLQADVFNEPLDCVIQPSVAVELSSSASGVLGHVFVERSQTVRRGEIVAQLESSAERAALDLIKARVESSLEIEFRGQSASLASRQLNRVNESSTKEFLSHEEIDTRETDARLSNIQLAQAEENKRFLKMELLEAEQSLDRRSIRSPIDGLVTDQMKFVGEYVDGDPVVKVVKLDPLHIETIVSAEHMGDIVSGMQAVIRTSAGNNSYAATVDRVDQVVDIASGTYGVRLNLPNPENLITAGLRCTVQFKKNIVPGQINSPAPAAALPKSMPTPLTTRMPMPIPIPRPITMPQLQSEPELLLESANEALPSAALPDSVKAETMQHTQTPVQDMITSAKTTISDNDSSQRSTKPASIAMGESKASVSLCDLPKVFYNEADAKHHADQLLSVGIKSTITQKNVKGKIGHLVVSPLLEEGQDYDSYLEQVMQTDISDYFRMRNSNKPDRVVFGSFNTSEGALRHLEYVLKQGLIANVIPWQANRTQFLLSSIHKEKLCH